MSMPVGPPPPLPGDMLAPLIDSVTIARYSVIAAYVTCFYDWIISLDQEVAYIYPSSWSAVKAAYLFCRYYPLVTAPFHIWGFVGDHEQGVCESYFRALYASAIPTILSAQFILMLRTYAFSGRKKWVLAVLSTVLLSFVVVTIWVISRELGLTIVFSTINRTGCFTISELHPPPGGGSSVQAIFNYRLGAITILAVFFDCINVFLMVRRCIQQHGALGSLSQTFVKQGIVLYVVMTALNSLTLATFFATGVLQDVKGLGPWLSYILPSALSCRLVLMLRRAASPTETDFRVEHSHVINDAFEMTTDLKPMSFNSNISTGGQAQP
ncbi:hypothetical protein V8E53_006882 [Lactarius tabidus]